jgi:uncharacterized protein (TIRG00374 family)
MGRTLAKLAVSGALIWLVLRTQDLDGVVHRVLTVNGSAVVLSILSIPLMSILAALRWSVILATMGQRVGIRVTYPQGMIGLFFNQCLPFSMGDFARMWFAYRAGISARIAINSVLLDRLVGALALLLMVTFTFPHFFALSPSPAAKLGTAFVLAAGYLGIVLLAVLDRFLGRFADSRIGRTLVQLAVDLRRLFSLRREAAQTILCGIIVQFASAVMVYVLARGLDLAVNPADCLFVVPIANLIQTLPISIGGWGVREGVFVAAFGMVGLAAPSALALSALFGLVSALGSLPGGIFWLLQKRAREKVSAA